MFSCDPYECAFCRSAIAAGQRWVRMKVYGSAYASNGPHYLRFHADLFASEKVSCWEKHQMEAEIARTVTRAA